MDLKQFVNWDENEKPLENIVTDGGYVGIFRTIACIGDSLSSGEFESTREDGKIGYHDYYDYSWGQYLARMAGCTVKNFSMGGMTAKCYCEAFGPWNGYMDKERKGHAQAYIIALGVNDILNCKMELGTTADICREDCTKNKDTFAGYYGRIVQQALNMEPRAKFFFVTIPDHGGGGEREKLADGHAALMHDMAAFFPSAYVLDIRKYGPVYDEAFRQKFFLGGHMNAAGYLLTARIIASYMDYVIRHNMEDFAQVGFIGTRHERK